MPEAKDELHACSNQYAAIKKLKLSECSFT